MNIKTVAITLGLLGLVPFTSKWWPSVPTALLELQSMHVIEGYAAVILSFLAGSHWAVGIKHQQAKLLIFSNVIALAAWLLLWMDLSQITQKFDLSYGLFAMLFFIQGCVEIFFPKGIWPLWYQILRGLLSLVVSSLLVLQYL